MAKRVALVSLIVLVGCFSDAALEKQRKAEVNRVADAGLAQAIMPTCSTTATTIEAPGTTFRLDGVGRKVQVQCGLIIAKLLAPAELQRFTTEICHGVDDAACSSSFVQMFLAQLRERYVLADWSVVSEKCTAHPIDCKQWINVELWALASHNDVALRQANDKMIGVNDQYAAREIQARADHDARMSVLGAVLSGAAQGAAQATQQTQTVNCTSNTVGAMTSTSCH